MVNKWDCWDMWNHHRIRWLTHKKKVNKIVGNKSTSYILKYKYFHAMAFCNNNQWIPRDISTQNYCKYKWRRIILLVILCIKVTLRCLPVLQQKRDILITWNVRRWHNLFTRDFQDVHPRALLVIQQSWIWRYEKDIFMLWKCNLYKVQ